MRWPLRIFLVRHGQVASNREMRYVGQRDEALTDLGREQARAVGEALAEVPIEAVISSPLVRAHWTAQQVASAHGLEVEAEERIREQSFGAWDGLSRDEVLDRDPEILAEWERRDDVEPPDGESQIQMQRRVLEVVRELADAAQEAADEAGGDEPRVVALVSHVGPIKAILSAALDIGLMNGRRIFLDPATVSVVDWGSIPIVRVCNVTVHGGWLNARWMHPGGGIVRV